MSASATAAAGPRRLSAARPERVSFSGVLRSEWIKLWSVRSTVVTLIAAALLVIVVGIGFAAVGDSADRGPAATGTDSLSLSLAGIELARLVVGVLGVLVVTSEYSTGLVRTAMTAVPRRTPVLAARAIVLGGVVFAGAAAAAGVAVLAGSQVYGGTAAVPLGDPATWRGAIGAAGYCAAVALLGVALGFLLRGTAAAVGVLVGALLVLPALVGLLPDSVTDAFSGYLPSNAGTSITSVDPGSGLLSVGPAAAVLAAWVLGALWAAAAALRRRPV